MASPIGFRLAGIAPETDPVYALRPQARAAFWRQAAEVGLRRKRKSLAQGKDKDGNPMPPISPLTRQARRANINPVRGERPYSVRGKASPYAPPLQATGKNSRTYALLRYEVRDESVWYYWGFDADTGMDWGIILARHAGGFWKRFVWPRPSVGFVKPRDVIGLSNQDLRDIAQEMGRWWLANRKRFAGRDMPDIGGAPAPIRVPVRPESQRIPINERGMGLVTPAQPGDRTRMLPAEQMFGFAANARRKPFGPRPPRGPVLPPRPPQFPSSPAAVAVPPMPPSPVLVGSGDNRRVGKPWLRWLLFAIGLGALAGVAAVAAGREEE